ncbi:MAG: ATP-grasp domain-containing protein, partial [Acidobacteria bacterium]|nr:ATP-grasp domain-containing protein [Acidobacteriota bacterium]
MANVVFVAPFLMPTTLDFVAVTASLPGVRLAVVSQQPPSAIPLEVRSKLVGHCQVERALDPEILLEGVRDAGRQLGGTIDRLLGALEQLQVPLAQVRQALGIEGMDVETAHNFRDKARMKQVLREHGLPCARYHLASSREGARRFAEETGFPLVVKPPDGAGAKATFRVDDLASLDQALELMRPSPGREMLLEEFITGTEHSFETISIHGEPVWRSITHYQPTPLEVLRNPWIQWCVLLPREGVTEGYADIREANARALSALGLGTGLTHMEWFRRQDRSIAISEVAARPPGAQITTLISHAHEADFRRAWAHLMVFDELRFPERKWATGAAFLRGQGRGQVQSVEGLEAAQKELGELVVEARLPRPGQPQASSYEGEGYV